MMTTTLHFLHLPGLTDCGLSMLLKLLPAQPDHKCTVTCSPHPAADHTLVHLY